MARIEHQTGSLFFPSNGSFDTGALWWSLISLCTLFDYAPYFLSPFFFDSVVLEQTEREREQSQMHQADVEPYRSACLTCFYIYRCCILYVSALQNYFFFLLTKYRIH